MGSKLNGRASLAVLVAAVLVFLAAVAFMIWGNSCFPHPDGAQDQTKPVVESEQASSSSAAIELPEI